MVSTKDKELHFAEDSTEMMELNELLLAYGARAAYRPSLVIKDFPMYLIVGVNEAQYMRNTKSIRIAVNTFFKNLNFKVVWDPTTLLFWVRSL